MLVTGYDLDCLTWSELGDTTTPSAPNANAPVDIRAHVSDQHHRELEELLADARNAVRLRDDNGALTAAWPMGLLRRAMLAAGGRRFPVDPGVAVEATIDELAFLPNGRGAVAFDELDRRRCQRAADSALDAPPTIGPEFVIPPLSALPRPLRLIAAAQLARPPTTCSATTSPSASAPPATPGGRSSSTIRRSR